jgi:hypothetical protein
MRALFGLTCVVALVIYYAGDIPIPGVLFGLLAGMSIEEVVQRRQRSRQ